MDWESLVIFLGVGVILIAGSECAYRLIAMTEWYAKFYSKLPKPKRKKAKRW